MMVDLILGRISSQLSMIILKESSFELLPLLLARGGSFSSQSFLAVLLSIPSSSPIST